MVLIGNRKWIREKNFIEIPADVENKLPLIEHQPAYTEMSVEEYKQSQTAVGPMPVVDIDLTSAIPLYERQYEYPYKLMLLGLHTLQVIVAGTETLAKASPPSRLRH